MNDRVTIDELRADRRAVLSLLLTQGRTYAEIAQALKIDEAAVRARAHAAAEQLAASSAPAPSPGTRALISDYLLGQQSHAERVRTCYALAASAVDRDWALRLARSLAPLSKVPLPVIPGAGIRQPSGRQPSVTANAKLRAPSRVASHRWPAVAVIAILIAGGAALGVALTQGGSSPKTPAALPSVVRTSAHGKVPGRTLHRLVLLPAGDDKRAFGAGAILAQGTSMLLLLQARGLPPNRHNSYGVWLFNSAGDAQLLGFISPPVGNSGTFSSGTTLPQDAVRFHAVIVTSETKAAPSAPGAVMLKATLPFS